MLLKNQAFLKAALNTAIFTGIGAPLLVILSLLLAMALQKPVFGRKTLRTLFISPLVIPVASVVLVFIEGMRGLEAAVLPLARTMPPGSALWVAYTKTAYRRTDIDRDAIWSWAREVGMDAVATFSIDERWSALRLKAR
jgi:ABC-type sugar transport system permease subunit